MNTTKATHLPEVWMVLKDPKQLAKLMVIQGISARQMAKAAGWKSHTYMQRLLRGEAKTLEVEPAVRIANALGVGVDDLFLARVSSDAPQNMKRGKAA